MKPITRGPTPIEVDLERLKFMLEIGVSKSRIAKTLKVGRTTLYKIIRIHDL